MKPVNVLLIEDDPKELEVISRVLLSNGYHIAHHVTNFRDAMSAMQQPNIDLVIIDVFLNGQPEGVQIAEVLCENPAWNKPYIFLTSSKDRTIFERAKLTRPFAFLLKPFNELEVLYALEMALEKYYEQQNTLSESDSSLLGDNYLFVKKKGALNKVAIADILYVEVEERYCNLHLSDQKYVVLISLARLETLLAPHGFIRTHRNFLVNKQEITQIILGEDTVVLSTGQQVPMSDTYKNIVEQLNILR